MEYAACVFMLLQAIRVYIILINLVYLIDIYYFYTTTWHCITEVYL